MYKPTISIKNLDARLLEVFRKCSHKTLAVWAADCAERVLPYFEREYPTDFRPRNAINTCRGWVKTGVFKMPEIRKASLGAHAAARDAEEDSPSRSAARAAGQAAATPHVARHALGPAIYALKAFYQATGSNEDVERERNWQYNRLLELSARSTD